jgi:hypothetical protein
MTGHDNGLEMQRFFALEMRCFSPPLVGFCEKIEREEASLAHFVGSAGDS